MQLGIGGDGAILFVKPFSSSRFGQFRFNPSYQLIPCDTQSLQLGGIAELLSGRGKLVPGFVKELLLPT
jgi:hypothetical protein